MDSQGISQNATFYLCAALILGLLLALSLRHPPRYPPGPKGLPILGNMFDIPRDWAWTTFKELGEQYGSDLIHFQALGSHIVVVNSLKAAKEIFEKRSSIYSDKEQSVMIQELTGWHRNWVFMKYGDRWRQLRRLFHQHFRPQAVPQYHSRQLKGVYALLSSLLDCPEHYRKHIRFMATAIILDIVYAIEVKPGDPLIDLVEDGVRTATEILTGDVHLVDVIPGLKYIPSWLPFAGFKRRAAKYKIRVDNLYQIPYEQFKASMKAGHARPCFAAALISGTERDEDIDGLEEMFIALTGTTYVGGSDTTTAALSNFILAITMFPESQLTAQDELDRLLEKKRLPTIEDQPSLPSITALVQEVLRWLPVLPLAIPHRSMVDDEYEGQFIPAGSTIIGNAWAMNHDNDVFTAPEIFRPDRFLNDDGSLREDVPYPNESFGFGRRICPGRHFAHDTLWLTIANILAVFKIGRIVDEHGHEVVPALNVTPRVLCSPEPFPCSFKLRFPEAAALIRSSAVPAE